MDTKPPGDETLNVEDRIEVTAFVERKAWILEKIKLLESMPPIEVFYGVDYILPANSGQPVPGLPTRQEVASWMAEHEKIEAETEQFDKGDMIRLKKMAKAKSEQNLSPEDTDLIELTLQTLFALDKLMHLLRVRRDMIEQMDMRLRWEDLRVGAWKERRAILDDIDRFVKTRARWSATVYDELGEPAEIDDAKPTLARSPTSKFLALARGARFSHSEALSKEAAAYASRVLAFHNTWITPSGQILDKMIERRTVPDQLLDEQDRLEDQTKELDLVSKFPMSLVMQWKKADELYGEFKKYQSVGRTLQQDIETALTSQPRPRLDEEFVSRTQALNSRLSQISDPITSRSFPRPTNPRYPDQKRVNDDLARVLSTELRAGIKAAKQAATVAKQYHALADAVKKIRKLNADMAVVLANLDRVTKKLTSGTGSENVDGLPPGVESPASLDPLRHSAFFALLPSVIADLESNAKQVEYDVRQTKESLIVLASAKLEDNFRADTEGMLARLESAKEAALEARREVERKAELLKVSRKIDESVRNSCQEVAGMRERVIQFVDRQRWKAERGRDGAPLTPDSPTFGLPADTFSPQDARTFLSSISSTVAESVKKPSTTLLPSLGPALADHLAYGVQNLETRIAAFNDLVEFWEDVHRQAEVMKSVRDDTHDLERRIEDLRCRLQSAKDDTLKSESPSVDRVSDLSKDVLDLRAHVERFTGGLASRIPFVNRPNPPRPSAFDHLPFSPAALDHSVKTDVNALSMSVAGGVDSLDRHLDLVRLAVSAKEFDAELQVAKEDATGLEGNVSRLRTALNQTASAVSVAELEVRMQELKESRDQTIGDLPARLRRRLSQLNQAISALESAPGAHDPVAHESIVTARKRALSIVANKVDDLAPQLVQLQEELQARLEGAGLGVRLLEAVESLANGVAHSETSVKQHKEAVETTLLEDSTARSMLDHLATVVNELDAQHEQTVASQLPVLQTARAAAKSSKSSQDIVVAALLTPAVDRATATESDASRLKPQFTKLKDEISQRLQLVNASHLVNDEVDAALKELSAFETTVNRTVTACSSSVPDAGAESSLTELQTEAQNHLKEFDGRLALRISDLQGAFKRLRDTPSPPGSVKTLVENLSRATKDVEMQGLRCRAQVVDFQGAVAERLSFARQVGILDKAVGLVEDSLEENRTRTDDFLAKFNDIETTSASEANGTPLAEKLSLLHSDARSLPDLLERATQPLLRNALVSAQTLYHKQGNRSTEPAYHDITSRYQSRLRDAQQAYTECLTSASNLVARIRDAEAAEAARLEAEIASQKQAEQDRLRREQEEREQVAAEAAAAREAEIERKRKEAEDEMRRLAEETTKREEAERQARLAAEMESKRIAYELALLKEAEDARRRAEDEAALKRVAEEAERFAALQLAEEARVAAQQAQHEAEAAARAAADAAAKQRAESEARVAELEAAAASSERVDVFGLQMSPSGHKRTVSKEELDLKVVIASLRSRLRSLSLHSIIRPSSKAASSSKSPAPALPTRSNADGLRDQYNEILSAFAHLPARLQDPSAQAELKSLRFEMEASKGMMTRVLSLAAFSTSSTACDNALSDLLEHLDSYPAAPLETTSDHQSDPSLQPEEQLSDRVGFSGAMIDAMKEAARGLGDDERVSAERTRLQQTWGELWEMSMDKINGISSRPPSSVHTPSETGSQRFVNLNLEEDLRRLAKQTSFSSLRRTRASSSLSNIAPTSQSQSSHLGIGLGRAPRSTSTNKTPIPSRSSSRVSTRSISGPIASSGKPVNPPSSYGGSVLGSTFSSRQRTMSNASAAGESTTTPRRGSVSRPRIPSGFMTPTGSEFPSPAASGGTRSAFASLGRSLKNSLGNSTSGPSRTTPGRSPMEPPVRKRKQYIPNQKHRVDVAVAKVVNELDPEYNVTVEPVSWKDQSGKYWIGDKDPKLCFCRILRSQTVMVRVGGGWVELSKFLRGHYDMFRVMPTGIPGSPPREEEERWISSATLLAAQNAEQSPSPPPEHGPTTPEPRRLGRGASLSPMGPSAIFAGGSPILVHRDAVSPMRGGTVSPASPRTRAGSSSPLTPLQFMRKAESSAPDLPTVVIRPTTPSRIPSKINRTGPGPSGHNPLSRSSGSRPAPTAHRLSTWRP